MSAFTTEQISLFLIPIIIAATILVLYLLGHRWHTQANSDLKLLRTDIRRYRGEIISFINTVKEYDEIEHEPFISRVASLQEKVEDFNSQMKKWEAQYVSIQDEIHSASKNPWKGILGAPIFWYLQRRDIRALREHITDLDASLEIMQEEVSALKQLGWEVAKKARNARSIDQRVTLLLDQLGAKNVHGDAFDHILERENRARNALAEIPDFFMNEPEASVLELAEEDSITQTYRILAETRPELDSLLKQVQAWEKQYNDAVKIVTRMRRVVGSLENSVANTAENLDLDEFNQRIYGLNIISQNLHATLTRLEVESITAVVQEAIRVQTSAQEMNAELTSARDESIKLTHSLNELNGGLKELSNLYAALATKDIHPIVWGQSQPALTKLSQQVNSLKPVEQPRAVNEAGNELKIVTSLNEERIELNNHCQEIAAQHAELMAMFNRPEIRHSLDWFKDAHQLAECVDEYAPENWSTSDGLPTLEQDINILERTMEELVFQAPDKPVPENELKPYLDQVRRLVQSYLVLRQRVLVIDHRLSEIQNIESSSREALKAVEANLTQITYLVGSNSYLNKIAGKQLSRFEDNLASIITDLSQKQQGVIEKKAARVNSYQKKIETSTSKWLKQLTDELNTQTTKLTRSLRDLDDIAKIDEKPLHDARQLLSTMPLYSEMEPKSFSHISEMIRELKQRSEYWQVCSAIRHALRDIEEPVLETHQQAEQSRAYVHEQLEDLERWLKRTEEWPPTTVKLDQEAVEMKSIDAQWDSIKGASTKALNLVQQLGLVGGKYQTLAEKIYQAGERVADQQGQIDELEKDLDDYESRWLVQRKSHQDSPTALREIDELLSSSDREYNQIKRDFKNGKKDYDEIVGALKALHRRVRLAQISIDENNVIDLNGRTIAYQE